ncbi:DUF6493 family protein [Streptomyces sp. NPDC005408]|uniref:DUF7824 domain-containing protein n=1 Tax=Streptomyces sp. NPDC005408 TaxID=3155341 RepID=UPI0033B23B2E
MKELLEAVRAGRSGEVPGLLKPLTPAERKALLAELKTIRAELRGWDWDRWRERARIRAAMVVAGAGCHTGAAAAAAWIGARDLRDWQDLPYGMIVDVLSDRDPQWLGDVAHRLAGRTSTAQDDYPLIHELVKLAKCPVPTTDGYVYGWAEAVSRPQGNLLATLREDTAVRILVPRLFETPQLARPLGWYDEPDNPAHWPSVLTCLADEGVLDRELLVDACVSRLLRGGRPGEMRFFLILLRRLALTPAEERARVADWMGMASDGTSTVAAHAQSVLGRIAGTGGLSTSALAHMSGAVLFRSEKKLVRAQLVLLGKVMRSDSEASRELLPVVAEAFGHQDVDVQERALKLVARHLRAVPPVGEQDLREELAASAALLSPAHRAAAVEVFGALADAGTREAYEEILPPPPEPRRLAPAADSVPELVEDLMVLLRADDDMSRYERTLDGLVRMIHREPEALAEALRATLADRWWLDSSFRWDRDQRFSGHPFGVEVVAAALLERVSVKTLHNARVRATAPDTCAHAGLEAVVNARLWEVAFFVRTRPLPFLLATPTWQTGALDPAELVGRLREYQRLDVPIAPVDFALALLRVPRSGADAVARAAADLGTKEGDRLAAWLSGGGPAMPALEADAEPEPSDVPARRLFQRPATVTRRKLHETKERLAIQREFPRPFHWLGRAQTNSYRHCYHWAGLHAHASAILPHEREALAGWLLPALMESAQEDLPGTTASLPTLAEAGGAREVAGPALHRALAAGLGARRPEDRLAAVDALLVLAARGQLDGELLGRDLAELVGRGTVKPNRLADSARTAAATGAYATTWSVLAGALPGLLSPDTPARGLGEILGVAADCVEHCGTAGTAETTAASAGTPAAVSVGPQGILGLAELATRRGSSQLVAQASRLQTALHQGADQSRPETAKTSR